MGSPNPSWDAEKARIERLAWWGDLAGKQGVSADGKVWHLHPLGGVANFSSSPQFRFTLEMMKKIFPAVHGANEHKLVEIADELNSNIVFYKLDTPLRRAHFFAQVMQETGPELVVEERLVWKAASLIASFSYFRAHPEVAAAIGYASVRPIKADGTSVTHEDQMRFANCVYGNRPLDLGNGSVESGDGYKYRGRGLKQLTGRKNYTDFNTWHEANIARWPSDHQDFVQNPDPVTQMKYAARSAAYFWLVGKLAIRADNGPTDAAVDSITNIVNLHTDSRQARKSNFRMIWNNKYFE
jgi:predicted chitinase